MINVQRKAFQWNNAYNDMESVEHHKFLASLNCYLFFARDLGVLNLETVISQKTP